MPIVDAGAANPKFRRRAAQTAWVEKELGVLGSQGSSLPAWAPAPPFGYIWGQVSGFRLRQPCLAPTRIGFPPGKPQRLIEPWQHSDSTACADFDYNAQSSAQSTGCREAIHLRQLQWPLVRVSKAAATVSVASTAACILAVVIVQTISILTGGEWDLLSVSDVLEAGSPARYTTAAYNPNAADAGPIAVILSAPALPLLAVALGFLIVFYRFLIFVERRASLDESTDSLD